MSKRRRMIGFIAGLMLLGLTVIGVPPAAAQVVVEARGSGIALVSFPPSGEEAHFSFQTSQAEPAGEILIDLRATNRVTGDKIVLEDGVALVFSSNGISFTGDCRVNGEEGSCEGYAEDHGEPGENDIFEMSYVSSEGINFVRGIPILSGDIEIDIVLE